MTKTSVAILGATGETGHFIIDALLESDTFEITALARPSSATNQKYTNLRSRGVKVVAVELTGPEDALVEALTNIDVIISTVSVASFKDQIPLAKAAKKAGVKRFVPSEFAMVIPPKGVHDLQDIKTDVLNEIKSLHLPWTVINVGWWYAGFLPRLASGRTDYVRPAGLLPEQNFVPGDGEAVCSMIDARDVGRYVARIIQDPRTLNKQVSASNFAPKLNELYALMEEISGEKIEKTYVSQTLFQQLSAKDIESQMQQNREKIAAGQTDYMTQVGLMMSQYQYSAGIRHDNTPEYAEYLGYLLTTDLYPDFRQITYREFFQEVLDGKARAAYSQ
ncbi:isoflavone reductase family protein [Colletotrichum kahawae]|uniref:Isoflavone reductase family protein n=1 Tax=Colletotrichum kahawae TaxID=34407 RepID=A0AAD9Y8A4_COLKA|nr:isoflavone reductase family protein [Colletotrichum kahawae]